MPSRCIFFLRIRSARHSYHYRGQKPACLIGSLNEQTIEGRSLDGRHNQTRDLLVPHRVHSSMRKNSARGAAGYICTHELDSVVSPSVEWLSGASAELVS